MGDEIEAVFGQQQDCLILFRKEEDNESAFQKVFEEAAVAFKGKILFSYAGSANQIQGKLAEFMGVTEEDYPTIRALLPANMKKFQFESDVNTVTIEQIGTFVDGVKDGSIEAHLKSLLSQKNKVTLLLSSVLNTIKSSTTQPRMSLLNSTLHGADIAKSSPQSGMSLVRPSRINQMSSLPNSTLPSTRPIVEIRGYPTLKWFPKGNKEGESYEGERDLPAFKKFLEENSEAFKEAGAGSAKQEEL